MKKKYNIFIEYYEVYNNMLVKKEMLMKKYFFLQCLFSKKKLVEKNCYFYMLSELVC